MLYEELLERLGLSRDEGARCLEKVTEDEPLLNRRDLGIMPVAVDKIVGTVSRCADVEADFQPRFQVSLLHGPDAGRRQRLERIREAMHRGETLPPLELYRLRGEYYVIDGHHRVAIAKEMGSAYLDAHVVELLPPADTPANELAHARSNFEARTRLHLIEVTDPRNYDMLLVHVTEHQRHLERDRGRSVPLPEAADDWYRDVYRPVVAELEYELGERQAQERFPGKTVGDLYLLLAEYKWLESERQGRDIGLNQAMLDLNLTREEHGWLREAIEAVMPCRLLGICPLAQRDTAHEVRL